DCLAQLKDRDNAILVLDWEIGADKVVEVLHYIKDNRQQETSTVFLIAAKMSEKIIAAGTEFGVNQIHTGDITKDKVVMALRKLIDDAKAMTPFKQLMIGVDDARYYGDWKKASEILEKLLQSNNNNTHLVLELTEN